MEEQGNGTATVLPAPVGIACEGCKHGIQQERILGRGQEIWWYCKLMHGWMWAGDLEEGYPASCSGWEGQESEE